MKKLQPLLTTVMMTFALLFMSTAGFAQGLEDFTNSTATASYADGSFVGNNGITWNYYHSRDVDTYPIDGNGLMLRRASDSKLESGTIPGGIGNFSLKMRKAFTGASERQLELFVNGVLKGTSATFGSASGADETVHIFEVNDINVTGDIIIMIKNVGATTSNRQTVIDDITWTGYETGADTQAPIAIFAPANAATDVPLNVKPTITFNEPIYTSPAGVLVDNTNVESLITFPVAFSATITDNTITVVPDAELEYETDYTLTVAAVEDEAANAMDAAVSVTFTTEVADTEAPIVTFAPADAATKVALNVNPTITFNEPIYTSPAAVLVDNTNVESLITFPVAFSATITDNTITVVPTAELEFETAYTLTVASVQDEAANAMDAPVSVTFTTKAEPIIGAFNKITTVEEIEDGYYVIANNGDAFAMNQVNTGKFFTHTAITPVEGVITNPDADIVWEIKKEGANYTLSYTEGADVTYVSYTGSNNESYAVVNPDPIADNQKWAVAIDEGDFTFKNVAVATRLLQYNSGFPRFACYTGSQQNLTLYKLVESGVETKYTVTFNVDGANGTLAATVNDVAIASGDEVAEGSDVVFTATPASGYKVSKWTLDGVAVEENTSTIYTVTNLQADATVTVKFDISTNIEEKSLSNFNLYPNPFTNTIWVENVKNVSRILVANLIGGQQVMEVIFSGSNNDKVNTTHLPSGVYLVTIVDNQGRQSVRKMIKK